MHIIHEHEHMMWTQTSERTQNLFWVLNVVICVLYDLHTYRSNLCHLITFNGNNLQKNNSELNSMFLPVSADHFENVPLCSQRRNRCYHDIKEPYSKPYDGRMCVDVWSSRQRLLIGKLSRPRILFPDHLRSTGWTRTTTIFWISWMMAGSSGLTWPIPGHWH